MGAPSFFAASQTARPQALCPRHFRNPAVAQPNAMLRLKTPPTWDDNYAMTSSGVALTIFIASMAGLLIVYPSIGSLDAIAVFALFNAAYAWIVARVASMAWDYFAPYARR